MVPLTDLILAILIASVAVFFASSMMWMVLPHHRKDFKFLEEKESGYIDAIKNLDIKPGLYMYPGCDHSKSQSDERKNAIKERWDAGPWGVLTVYPGKPNFGMNLLKTFLTFLVITIFVAYITGIGVAPGADYMHVFRIAGTTAILGHCMGGLCGSFFMGKPTRFIITDFIDGIVYALVTAGIIASMWPAAQSALDGMLLPPGVN
ncbi:MAG: hypothetical protein P1U42_00260 [Phycisphaerales bacterium]|jgi:hypothetical protein|nr:hypothetical protein [Phycisphaerales bacterium]